MSTTAVDVPSRAREERPVRWLAESLLPEDHAGLRDLPPPLCVSGALGHDAAVRAYVVDWARHPQAGGSFAARTRWLRWLPDAWLLRILTALRYDGIVYASGPSILGHVFYQVHGRDVHGFSVAVSDGFEGRGYSHVMLLDYLAHAASRAGVRRARLGRLRNSVTQAAIACVRAQEARLGWRASDDGWVSFSS